MPWGSIHYLASACKLTEGGQGERGREITAAPSFIRLAVGGMRSYVFVYSVRVVSLQ